MPPLYPATAALNDSKCAIVHLHCRHLLGAEPKYTFTLKTHVNADKVHKKKVKTNEGC